MYSRINHIIDLLVKELGLFLGISLGVFLFVLFFQPFPLDGLDFNNRLILVAGLGAIVFVFTFLVRVVFNQLIQNYEQSSPDWALPYYVGSFLILALSSVAFAFYLHYVGFVPVTFHTMFEIILICIATILALWLSDVIKDLKHLNAALIIENKLMQKQVKKLEDNFQNKSIEFVAENNSEKLNLPVTDVAFIRSADNYVEIVFKEGDKFRKKLIRSTLKNIEHQIKPYSNFVRCHRICIVNSLFIDKLQRNYNNHLLRIKGYDEQIPVSRQYLLKLKETL
jgi:DNA-binding LytR/AlgR family response regulator